MFKKNFKHLKVQCSQFFTTILSSKMTTIAEQTPPEAKRGKKRSLAEVESQLSEPPSPKRRKLSNGNSEHIAIQRDEAQINKEATAHEDPRTSISTAMEEKQSAKEQPTMPNAMSSSLVIDLLDSDSPTTNDSATFNSNDHQNHLVPNSNSNGSNHVHLTANNREADIEMNDVHNAVDPRSAPVVIAMPPSRSHSAAMVKCCGSHLGSQRTSSSTMSVPSSSASIIRPCNDGSSQFEYLTIWTDKRCLLHAIPVEGLDDDFNERPARLHALHQMIDRQQWHKSCRITSALQHLPTIDDLSGYQSYHQAGYLTDLKNQCCRIAAGNYNVTSGSDTYLVRDTWQAAMVSAGLVIEATKHVFSHVPPLPTSPAMSMDFKKTKSRVEKDTSDAVNNNIADDTANNQPKQPVVAANGHSEQEAMDIDDGGDPVDDGKDPEQLETSTADARSQHNGGDGASGNAPECPVDPAGDSQMNEDDAAQAPVANGGDPVLSKQSTVVIEDAALSENEDEATKYKDKHPKKYAVVLNRPPGHHCDGSKYSGYCFVNSTAVAIEKQLNMDTKVRSLFLSLSVSPFIDCSLSESAVKSMALSLSLALALSLSFFISFLFLFRSLLFSFFSLFCCLLFSLSIFLSIFLCFLSSGSSSFLSFSLFFFFFAFFDRPLSEMTKSSSSSRSSISWS